MSKRSKSKDPVTSLFDWSSLDRGEKCDQMRGACATAMGKLYRGEITAFAFFAKKIGQREKALRKQVRHKLNVNKKKYAEWKKAYRALSKKARKRAEANIYF